MMKYPRKFVVFALLLSGPGFAFAQDDCLFANYGEEDPGGQELHQRLKDAADIIDNYNTRFTSKATLAFMGFQQTLSKPEVEKPDYVGIFGSAALGVLAKGLDEAIGKIPGPQAVALEAVKTAFSAAYNVIEAREKERTQASRLSVHNWLEREKINFSKNVVDKMPSLEKIRCTFKETYASIETLEDRREYVRAQELAASALSATLDKASIDLEISLFEEYLNSVYKSSRSKRKHTGVVKIDLMADETGFICRGTTLAIPSYAKEFSNKLNLLLEAANNRSVMSLKVRKVILFRKDDCDLGDSWLKEQERFCSSYGALGKNNEVLWLPSSSAPSKAAPQMRIKGFKVCARRFST